MVRYIGTARNAGRNEIGEQREVHDGAPTLHLEPADRERGGRRDEQRDRPVATAITSEFQNCCQK
jgi:hypothetical protein